MSHGIALAKRAIGRQPGDSATGQPDVDVVPPKSNESRDITTFERLSDLPPVRYVRTHGALICILILQLALTLRLENTAFQDEAIYVYGGHRQLELWLHGTPIYDDYGRYFSGAPFLYPILAASADDVGGLGGARFVSLGFALAATGLLYLTSRRMFSKGVALTGAALFAVAEPTLFNGNLATYDAPVQFLLALAVWICVRTTLLAAPVVLLAAPVLVLAAMTKYAAVLYVPLVVLMSAVAIARDRGLVRAAFGFLILTGATAAFFWLTLITVPELQDGMRFTTTDRVPANDSALSIATASFTYIGPTVLLALVGAVIYCRREPIPSLALSPRHIRVALSVVLIAAALAAPSVQMWLNTLTSLHKHVGFGLWFIAPLAGVAIAHLVDARSFRRLAAAVAISVGVAWLGATQATILFRDWPNSDSLVSTLQAVVRPVTGRYLVEEDEVPRYYFRDTLEPYQWTGTSTFSYTRTDGTRFEGPLAYETAINDKYFDVVAFRYGPAQALATELARVLNSGNGYELVATIPFTTSSSDGDWQIWRRY